VTMWQAIGHVLPIAVAVALSSVPIMATVLMLLSPNRHRSAVPFLFGWVVGLVAVVTAFTLLAQTVPTPRHPQLALAFGEIGIGLALMVLAAITWRRNAPAKTRQPRWLRAVSSLGPWSSFGFALALNLRPKAVLLAAATGLIIRADGLGVAEGAIVIGVYTIISATTVAGPVVATAVAPDKTQDWLISTRHWLNENSRVVAVVIMVMVGVVLIGNGLTRL
jgi:Sap, sulfolipid-1-addressing protein